MAEVTLQLRVTKPWWWTPAVWLAAVPIFVRYAFTEGPPESVTNAFIDRWTKRIPIEAVTL